MFSVRYDSVVLRESTVPEMGEGAIIEQVVLALRRIIRAIDLHSRYLAHHHGLTGPQLTILRTLSASRGTSVGDLARSIHLSQATVTGVLDRLEKHGLVRRVPCETDKRRVLVSLTPAAAEVLSQAPPLLQERFTQEMAKLENWEQTQILSSLQRVVAMMEAKDIEATPMLTTGPIDAPAERTSELADYGTSAGAPPPARAAQCQPPPPSRGSEGELGPV